MRLKHGQNKHKFTLVSKEKILHAYRNTVIEPVSKCGDCTG